MKNFISFILLFLFVNSNVHGQPKYGLSNYRIPVGKKGAEIATVFHSSIKDPELKILEDASGIFKVKKNRLFLKANRKVKASAKPFSLKLSIGGEFLEVDLVADNFIKNKVIAHRGAFKHYNVSENSLGALQNAIDLGCEGSEFDVWVTKDGKAVVSHDPTIGGVNIEHASASEVLKVPLKNNEFVPGLEEYLALGKKQNKTFLILEIKHSGKGFDAMMDATDTVMNVVSRMKAQGWVKYISFSYSALQRIKKYDPFADVSYLSGDRSVEQVKQDGLSGIDYNTSVYEKDKKMIKAAQALGLSVNVWTVNKRDQLLYFLNENVDFITTDEPALLLELIKENFKK